MLHPQGPAPIPGLLSPAAARLRRVPPDAPSWSLHRGLDNPHPILPSSCTLFLSYRSLHLRAPWDPDPPPGQPFPCRPRSHRNGRFRAHPGPPLPAFPPTFKAAAVCASSPQCFYVGLVHTVPGSAGLRACVQPPFPAWRCPCPSRTESERQMSSVIAVRITSGISNFINNVKK